jgi:DNA-binding NtrC family response regulator
MAAGSVSRPTDRPDAGVIVATGKRENVAQLRTILSSSEWRVRTTGSAFGIFTLLESDISPVILSDSELPDGRWQAILASLADFSNPPRLIVFTGLADERLWAEVLNLGAYDLLAKPFDEDEVTRVVELAWLDWVRNSEGARSRSVS